MTLSKRASNLSVEGILESFKEGAVDVGGLYSVCSALANPSWLVVDPRTIPATNPEVADTGHLAPLVISDEISHVMIPVLHEGGHWTAAITALRERKIMSFQLRKEVDLHRRSFETARQLCSRGREADDEQSWLEERCDYRHSSPSVKDEGIHAIVHVLDSLLDNPAREEIVILAWRYALGEDE